MPLTPDPTAAAPAPEPVLDDLPVPAAAPDGWTKAWISRRKRPTLLGVVTFIAVALFALWGTSGPLLGTSVLASTNSMVRVDPYASAGYVDTPTDNTLLQDIYTAQLPSTIVYKDLVGQDSSGQWNPYISGGTPLAAIPSDALYSPLTVVYYLMPTWLAPAYEHLLEIICSVGATFLFLRRLRISRVPALTGGLVFTSSAFMVLWLGFPQTRVAAFIPVLFWALERLVQERRLRDCALIAVAVAALLLGGFPSVAGYALLTGAAYLLTRIIAEYRGDLRRLLKVLAGSVFGLLAGIGLAAVQLLPFATFFSSWFIEGRDETGTTHIEAVALVTAIAPWAFGTANPQHEPQWILSANIIEEGSYIGAAALVLALVALALARRGRTLLPTATWWFMVAGTAAWGTLVYLGGPPLAVLQDLPGLRSLFGENFIGRGRSVLGFLIAVLAAVGFELLLRWREQRAPAAVPLRLRLRRWAWPAAVAAATGAVAITLILDGHRIAAAVAATARATATRDMTAADRNFILQVLLGLFLVAAAIGCVIVLWRTGRKSGGHSPTQAHRAVRFGAAALIPLLVTAQGLFFTMLFNPISSKDTFYPSNDTFSYLGANLGEQRFAATTGAMTFSINTAYQLRSTGGHTFINDAYAQLVSGMPDDPVPESSYITFGDDIGQATSPILDVLGTKYFVAALSDPVFGTTTSTKSDGTDLTLQPGQPTTFAVPATGGLRAVGFTPTGTVPEKISKPDPKSSVSVVIRDATGKQVASSKRLTVGMTAGTVFELPVAAQAEPDGTKLTATVTLDGPAPVTVAAAAGAIAPTAVSSADDGLDLVHVGTSVIYQRLNALPRIRWASQSEVITDQSARVAKLADGAVPASTVVLSAPGPAASGAPATVHVTEDGSETVSSTVDAQGAGYLVVADADQVGWAATVDGKKAPLVAADEGVVAVAVPAGEHTVTLRYAAPHDNAGTWITAATAILLIVLVLAEWWWLTRRTAGRRRQQQPQQQ